MRRKLFSLLLAVLLLIQSFSYAESYYVGNRNTGKFHYPSCASVGQMKESNKVYLTYTQAIDGGYVGCKRCYPTGTYVPSYQVVSPPQKQVTQTPKKKSADVVKQSPKPSNKITQKILNFDGKSSSVNTIIQNGSSLMEVRSFADAMGFYLGSENGAVSVSGNGAKTLYLYPNSTKARLWNGYDGNTSKDLVSPVKTQVIGGRTYVPVRFLVESLGYSVNLDGNNYYIQGEAKSDYVTSTPNVQSQGYNNSQPQSEDIEFFYERFIYKNNDLDIKMAVRNNTFWVNATSIASLCGLYSEIRTSKSGRKFVWIDNFESVGASSLNSRSIRFDEGSSRYLRSIGIDQRNFEEKYAEAEAFVVGDSFFVPAIDFFVGIGLSPEYTDSGTILTDVRF